MASLIVLCIAGGILFGRVWIHLIKHPKLDDVNVYENETVILGEVDPFYHGQVTITSDHIPLGQHEVEIYSHDSSCMHTQIPTVQKFFIFEDSVSDTMGGSLNLTHLYLFPESVIQYEVVPEKVETSTNGDTDQHVYITVGSEINLFNPRTCTSQGQDCQIIDRQPYNGTSLHRTFTSRQRGYYNVHVRINSSSPHAFNLNITTVAIDRNLTTHKCLISQDNSFCQVDLSFKSSSRKVCLMAFVGHPKSTAFPSYVTLEIKITRFWIKWVLIETILPLMFSLIVIVSVAFVVYHVCRRFVCKRTSEYTPPV